VSIYLCKIRPDVNNSYHQKPEIRCKTTPFFRQEQTFFEKNETNFSKNVLFVQNDTNKKTGEMLHSGILMKIWVENLKDYYNICGKYLDCDE
jgi:hypothetical protein